MGVEALDKKWKGGKVLEGDALEERGERDDF